MRAKITIKQTYEVEIDGKPVNGSFQEDSEWEGMIRLKSDSPMGSLIIQNITKSANSYDLIPKILGGNLPVGKEITFEADVVRADCGHVGTAATSEFKDPRYTHITGDKEGHKKS